MNGTERAIVEGSKRLFELGQFGKGPLVTEAKKVTIQTAGIGGYIREDEAREAVEWLYGQSKDDPRARVVIKAIQNASGVVDEYGENLDELLLATNRLAALAKKKGASPLEIHNC